ncbi:hypothetical protein [Actinomadura mexicana]|uniref:Uncharacterized protein n=1 Tax=Actinomadura mexicana TaxID=134959 RepID=A0A238XVT6_9ACTN|nr:hypothetical protein [Actinomadura mexicana]SNR62668.1 hypothetical protein SAMN06265355_10516 [Actinomadura mexicana]
MRNEKLTPRAREPAEPARVRQDADGRAGVAAARDEAARALDRLDAARRRTARARRGTGAGAPPPADEQRLAEAAHALAEAARELTRLVRDRGPRPAAGAGTGERTRRPAGDGPLVTLDLAHSVGPGWRLYQFTTADRDAHRWHLRHDGHAAGTVTHVLNVNGRRTGWETYDARGFRLRPAPGPDAYPPAAPTLWSTRTAAVRAIALPHRCP